MHYLNRDYRSLVAVLAILLVLLKVSMNRNDPLKITTEVNHPVKVAVSNPNLNKADGFVKVPISQIMSGKPYVLPQNDGRIISYIWSHKLLHPPSKKPYKLKNYNDDPSMGQAQFILGILKNKTNGFFVECGALDGETRSNTLFMEMHLQWKGLLIEGDPSNFALLQKKHRKAWTANACLSVKPYPHTAQYHQSFSTGKVLKEEVTPPGKHVTVQCMPLFSLLDAVHVTKIDYFSLDVEGSELQVLKTIPWDKVSIRTLSVEYKHTSEGKQELLKYMKAKGYRVAGEVHAGGWANDVMFVHKKVSID